jgi:hypothetical protein
MNRNYFIIMSIFDIWFILSVVGFLLFLFGIFTEVTKDETLINGSIPVVLPFICFIVLTTYLSSKVKFTKHNPVRWVLVQFLFSLGGFIWYYIAIYRKHLLQGDACV